MTVSALRSACLSALLVIVLAEPKSGKNGPVSVLLDDHKGFIEPAGNFSLSINNHICLKTRFVLSYDIEYFARSNNLDYIEMKRGMMPDRPSNITGMCMNSTDNPWISMSWHHGAFLLNFTFSTHRHETGDTWFLHRVELTYNMRDPSLFPNVAHLSDRTVKHAVYTGRLFETPVGESYECSGGGVTVVTLTNVDNDYEVYLYLEDMQFQPAQIFDDIFSPSKKCPADLVAPKVVYNPHLHWIMGSFLLLMVFSCAGGYNLFGKFKGKMPPPGTFFANPLVPTTPKYDPHADYDEY